MKLLLDENLSGRVVPLILDLYPDSTHVKARSLVFGHPPKLVFLRVGNSPTSRIIELLRSNHVLLSAFDADPNASILVLP